RLCDFGNLGRVRWCEDFEAIGRDDDYDAGALRRSRIVDDAALDPTRAYHVRVTREPEQPPLSCLDLEPAFGGECVDHGVRLASLTAGGGGEQPDHPRDECASRGRHVR